MSALSSSSTTAQVKAAYDDNASYREDNSTAKARIFITATKILLRRTASQMTKGSNAVSLRPDLLQAELKDAAAWLEARDPDARVGPRVVRADLRRFR